MDVLDAQDADRERVGLLGGYHSVTSRGLNHSVTAAINRDLGPCYLQEGTRADSGD